MVFLDLVFKTFNKIIANIKTNDITTKMPNPIPVSYILDIATQELIWKVSNNKITIVRSFEFFIDRFFLKKSLVISLLKDFLFYSIFILIIKV